jgi:hypothetical protein
MAIKAPTHIKYAARNSKTAYVLRLSLNAPPEPPASPFEAWNKKLDDEVMKQNETYEGIRLLSPAEQDEKKRKLEQAWQKVLAEKPEPVAGPTTNSTVTAPSSPRSAFFFSRRRRRDV